MNAHQRLGAHCVGTLQQSTAAEGALVRHILFMDMMIKVEFENNLANVKSCQTRSRCWHHRLVVENSNSFINRA